MEVFFRKVSPGGVVSTLAGSGMVASADGIGAAASFYFPYSVAVDAGGVLFVTSTGFESFWKVRCAI
jgi:hypothetical protein